MADYCWCELEVEGTEAEVARFAAAARGAGPRYAAERAPGNPGPVDEFCFHSLCPVPQEVLGQDYSEVGYHWEVANWGVKWGACYRFWTAWGPPLEFLDKVAADWPALEFSLKYEIECGVRGSTCWDKGKLVSNHAEKFECDSPAAGTDAGTG